MSSAHFKKNLIILGVLLIALLAISPEATAQCAMCRASVESNVSEAGGGIGEGLNHGILYLMLAPYILLSVVGYAWYKHSKKYTEERRQIATVLKRTL